MRENDRKWHLCMWSFKTNPLSVVTLPWWSSETFFSAPPPHYYKGYDLKSLNHHHNKLLVPLPVIKCVNCVYIMKGLWWEAHPLFWRPELLQSIQRQQISWVFMEELDRLFQPPLLPQSRSIQDPRRPRVPPVLRPHPCVHAGGCVSDPVRRVSVRNPRWWVQVSGEEETPPVMVSAIKEVKSDMFTARLPVKIFKIKLTNLNSQATMRDKKYIRAFFLT